MLDWFKRLFSRDRRVAKTIKSECDTLRRWSERASAKSL